MREKFQKDIECIISALRDAGYDPYVKLFKGNGLTDEQLNPAPVVETEAEVVDTPAEETAAPQTFDAGIIAAAAAVISLAGYTLSKKSR